MFGQAHYNEYIALQEQADREFELFGETEHQIMLQKKADQAYMAYEYAAGLRNEDY